MIVLFLFVLLLDQTLGSRILALQRLQYSPQVSAYRQLIVQNNLKIVRDHNMNSERTFNMKFYPQFGALTQQEFKAKYAKMNPLLTSHNVHIQSPSSQQLQKQLQQKQAKGQRGFSSNYIDLSSYDPRIYNQGNCGNCYAFSTVSGINLYNRIRNNSVPSLSIEQLTDCSNNPNQRFHNLGCEGGSLFISLWYIEDKGLVSEADYPLNMQTYIKGNAQPCLHMSSGIKRYSIKGFYPAFTPGCELQMLLLKYYHPVATAMHVNATIMQHYDSGIITGCSPYISEAELDHAVLFVGFKTNTPVPYLKVKNSWGSRWGEKGFFRISARNNTCGICYHSVASH